MRQDPFSTGKELAPDLLRLFQVPQYLLSEGTRRSNGFYDYEETFDPDGHLQAGCQCIGNSMWSHHLPVPQTYGSAR